MKNGYLSEYVFINNINNRKYKETNILVQELLKELYPKIKDNDLIIAYKYGKYAKVDIVVCVRNIKKGISMKTGNNNSVHLEKIDKFCKCLQKYSFKESERLRKYLYSDGTNNNTGENRYSAKEYQQMYPQDIEILNKELEKYKKILITRFLIKTDVNYKVNVDAVVYGDINNFIWATKKEILEYLNNKKVDSVGVHVSSLFFQSWDKNLKYNPLYEKCRDYIQIKWFSLFEDILMIMCNRNMVEPHKSFKSDSVKYKKKNSVITKFLTNIWSG